MTTERMTIHKALSESKILDSRIDGAIYEGIYCLANKHSNNKIKGVGIEDYKKVMQGHYDKATDLIARNNAIKKAVVLSNAVTKVKIGDVEYTVAEAIWMKNHGIEHKEELLAKLKQQYSKAQVDIEKNNGKELDERAEKYAIGLYGGTKDVKVDPEDIEKTKKEFIKANQYELLDPIGILAKIEDLEKEIDSFKSEVDSILSTSNAITEIEISY